MNSKFSIQEHYQQRNKHSHYDLRLLEPKNKSYLVSWALPKKRFPDSGERLLAIRTVNHNVDYMHFHGQLKNNDNVKLIDFGNCDIVKWTDSVIIVVFHGKSIKGTFVFVRMSKESDKQDNWIVMGKKHAA